MNAVRVIPILLLRGERLVKTRQFGRDTYIGDPINCVRIFSDKQVDELIVLDIDASRRGLEPNYRLIADIAGECFMPLAYGGGIRNLDQVRRLIRAGVEKVVINSAATENLALLRSVSQVYGSQAVVGAIDARRTRHGYQVMARSATQATDLDLDAHAAALAAAGAGEILVNSIDRDGTMSGYDLDLLRRVTAAVSVPVVAAGGAGSIEHLRAAVTEGGAAAVAAGSLFVFYGRHRAVLINYPHDLEMSLQPAHACEAQVFAPVL